MIVVQSKKSHKSLESNIDSIADQSNDRQCQLTSSANRSFQQETFPWSAEVRQGLNQVFCLQSFRINQLKLLMLLYPAKIALF